MKKQFDQPLFEKHDAAARAATSAFIRDQGWEVRENPDIYAQDLIATKGDAELLIECEVKVVWDGGAFPFDTVQLPERKRKFFTPNTIFFVWNKDLSDAVYFSARDIQGLKPVLVPNKYIKSGEYFFQVPMNVTKLVSNAPVQDSVQEN
tara:strand:+ start:710 stop:1156 length:447 start_codon:yes stop_codon:yes gene_type:complete